MIGHLLEFLIVRCLARVFPGRYRVIPRMPDGAPLLRQFRILSIGAEKPRGVPPWYHFSVYLQSFVNAEVEGEFHVHRWRRMISLVLSGWFCEERVDLSIGVTQGGAYRIAHLSPSVYTMASGDIHRFHYVAPRTWTLFIMVGRNEDKPMGGWGYYARATGEYRPWDQAIPQEKRIAAL